MLKYKKNRQSKYISGKLGTYLAVCGLNCDSTWVVTVRVETEHLNRTLHESTKDLAREKGSSTLRNPRSLCCSAASLLRLFTLACYHFVVFHPLPIRSQGFRRYTYKQFHNSFGSLDNWINTKKSENTMFLLHLRRC